MNARAWRTCIFFQKENWKLIFDMAIDFKISAESFKREYQERLPFIIKGAVDTSSVKWSDINDVIARCDPQSENFRVSFPGGNIDKDKYVRTYFHVGDVRRKLDTSALYGYLREGGALVANHIYDEPVFNDYAKDIAQFTGRQTVTSAYIAFGETDSDRAHWDFRDVFAVQLNHRQSPAYVPRPGCRTGPPTGPQGCGGNSLAFISTSNPAFSASLSVGRPRLPRGRLP